MKAKIASVGHNRVRLEYDDCYTGNRVCRIFVAPPHGGYVREIVKNGLMKQVYSNLSLTVGDALDTWTGGTPLLLIDCIRLEYKAMRHRSMLVSNRGKPM